MNASELAVSFALFVGSVRALQLRRHAINVGVVNAITLKVIAEGRVQDLPNVLAGSGAAVYLEVVRSVSQKALQASREESGSPHKQLERHAISALVVASRKLRRFAILDYAALLAIAFAGINALTGQRPTLVVAVGLFAATLLVFANLYATRNIATRMYAGAFALVDGLVSLHDAAGAARSGGS